MSPATARAIQMSDRKRPELETVEELKEKFFESYAAITAAENKAKKSRVEAAKFLVRIQFEVGMGSGKRWWFWYKENMKGSGCSESNAKKLLQIGHAPDPDAAHEKEKAATRTRVAALRAKKNETVHDDVRFEPEIIPPADSTERANMDKRAASLNRLLSNRFNELRKFLIESIKPKLGDDGWNSYLTDLSEDAPEIADAFRFLDKHCTFRLPDPFVWPDET